jgi:predicted XRE-type DNA-binding protein
MNAYTLKINALVGEDKTVTVAAESEVAAKHKGLAEVLANNPGFVKQGNINILSVEPVASEPANDSTELTIVEAKNLIDFLSLSEQSQHSLYSDTTQQEITKKIALTDNLVYEPTYDGEKAMNADSTAINKFAALLDKTSAAIFKRRTESANADRTITKGQVERLKNNRSRAISQFEELKKARMQAIKETLIDALNVAWQEKNVEYAFRKSLAPEPKESLLTEKGSLKTAVKKLIDELAQADKNAQIEHESRVKDVEIACHRAGINTPFDAETIGPSLYDKDKAVFQARLERLIGLDASRKLEIEAKIIRDQEAQKQREINEALRAQQGEVNRVAREEAIAKQAEENRLRANRASVEQPKDKTPVNSETTKTVDSVVGPIVITVTIESPLLFMHQCPEVLKSRLVGAQLVMTFKTVREKPTPVEFLQKVTRGLFDSDQQITSITIENENV